MTADPFRALGLPARPDLTDDDVRAAWRRVAAATHPDRADGGDPARFAVAAAAYTELRTRYGRGEACADLAAGNSRRQRRSGPVPPHARAARPDGSDARSREPAPGRAAAGLASRVRRGRPALLALRIAIAAGISAAAFAVAGAQPAAAGLAAGALTWLVLTARRDLMAPGTAHARSYLVRSGRG